MEYNQNGSWLSLAGLLVILAGHFNVVIAQNDAVTIIAGIITLGGIVKQYFAHRDLAIASGRLPQ